MVAAGVKRDLASVMRAATFSGSNRLGVPPPKKMEVRCLGPMRAASKASSRRKAATIRACGILSRTWELKSQYGHLERQNGQWM